MTKTLMWQFLGGPGTELLELETTADGVVAESSIVRGVAGLPFAVRYRIECDADWRTRLLRIEVGSGTRRTLEWRSDGTGNWETSDGERLDEIAGCVDVDLAATAFTNTLPIRRLDLQPDKQETIAVAYVDIPELTFDRAEQRYTCLERNVSGARYLYESLKDSGVGYSAEITTDGAGLVIEYPDYARRVEQ